MPVKILTKNADQGHSCSDKGDKIKALCIIPIDNRTTTSQGKYILPSGFFLNIQCRLFFLPCASDNLGAYSHPSQEVKLKTGFWLFLGNASTTCHLPSSKATYWKKIVVSHKIYRRSQFAMHHPSIIQGTRGNQTPWDYLIYTYIHINIYIYIIVTVVTLHP